MGTALLRMIEAVGQNNRGGGLAGNQPLGEVAQEWIDEGFCADTAPEWWAAGAWDAASTAALRDEGLCADDCSRAAGEGPCGDESIAYAVSNSDLSVRRAVELVGRHDDVSPVATPARSVGSTLSVRPLPTLEEQERVLRDHPCPDCGCVTVHVPPPGSGAECTATCDCGDEGWGLADVASEAGWAVVAIPVQAAARGGPSTY